MDKFAHWVLLLTANSFVKGFVLCKLWEWFIEKPFQAPHLSVPLAMGIWITLWLFQVRVGKEEKTVDDKAMLWAAVFVIPGYALAFGWIYKQFL